MSKKKREAFYNWLCEHDVAGHLSFIMTIVYVIGATGLALKGGIRFLVLNILSGAWFILRLYFLEYAGLWSEINNCERFVIKLPDDVEEEAETEETS